MGIKRVQVGFSAGELAPTMYGRFDDQKYGQGLARCRNFIVRPQGPVELRPGTRFVRAAKYADKKCRLIPFMFTIDQTMVLEFGAGYIRFHTTGQTLMKDGVPYEISTPYKEEDLFDLHYVQSMDVMTIVHSNYPPKELRRLGATDWRLTDISFSPPLSAPTITSVTYRVEAGDGVTLTEGEKTRYDLKYKVTAVKGDGIDTQESEASAIGSCKGNLYLNSSSATISWTSVSGAQRYRVYKNQGGLYSFIGETEELSLEDDNLSADSGITPPRYDLTLNTTNSYPSAVAYFEQRRVFAGTQSAPQTIWMTRSGTEADLSYTIPSQADNRIRFTIAAQEASRITHLIPLSQLVALTNSTEFKISSGGGSALAPDAIDAKVQANIGASSVQPVIVNSTMVYASARGSHVRELGYNWQASGFTTGDISIRSEHFFENNPVVDMALSKSPDSIIWCPSRDGKLLGCTYLPEQNICGWHCHEFQNGAVESCTTVIEGDEDIPYLLVRRKIEGRTVRYIERMNERYCGQLQDAYHVDCGGLYEGEVTQEVSGLSWLEGQEVSIFANGCVLPQQTVKDGKVKLSQPSTKVAVGLPIIADFQTLPVAVQLRDGSYGITHSKNVNDVAIRVVKSSGLWVGPSFNQLVEVKQRTTENYGSPPDWMSKEISVMAYAEWNDSGQICIRQVDPLPLTIVSVTVDLAQ